MVCLSHEWSSGPSCALQVSFGLWCEWLSRFDPSVGRSDYSGSVPCYIGSSVASFASLVCPYFLELPLEAIDSSSWFPTVLQDAEFFPSSSEVNYLSFPISSGAQ